MCEKDGELLATYVPLITVGQLDLDWINESHWEIPDYILYEIWFKTLNVQVLWINSKSEEFQVTII